MTSASVSLLRLPTILMYHGVEVVPEDPYELCVTPAEFSRQMAWLADHGLRGVSVSELMDAVGAGRPSGLVGLTFDDGYLNNLDQVVPSLLRHGFTATMFIVSRLLGKTNEWDAGPVWPLVSAAQVLELAEAGMEIGSHTATHARLVGVGGDKLTAEVRGCRSDLSALLGRPVRGFCYPYGSMDAAAKRAVREAGYAWAVAVEAPLPDIGMMTLPRIPFSPRLLRSAQDSPGLSVAKRLALPSYVVAKGLRRKVTDVRRRLLPPGRH